MSTMNTRAGPKSCADISAMSPTGPAPITATTSPALISARSAAKNPVERMSPTNMACSSVTPAGIGSIVWSARGTTTYSDCPPPRPPKYSPWPKVALLTHWLNQPLRQKEQWPQDVKKLETTRSPGLNRLTSEPTSWITPTSSCPRTAPPFIGVRPCRMCRSDPHTAPSVTLTSASPEPLMPGLGTSVTLTSPTLRKVSAFMGGILLSLPEPKLQPREGKCQHLSWWRASEGSGGGHYRRVQWDRGGHGSGFRAQGRPAGTGSPAPGSTPCRGSAVPRQGFARRERQAGRHRTQGGGSRVHRRRGP